MIRRIIIYSLILGCTIVSIWYTFFRSASFEEIMKLKLIEINKMCPRMIDNETRFDSIFLLHEKNIQYNYTLININKSDPILDDLIKQVKPILIQRVKVNNEFKLIRVYKASATYLYRDKDGDTLFNFTVTPQQYSN